MALKTIRHAIFEWFDPDGTRHYAFRGQTVDVPDHVVDAFERFDVFHSDNEIVVPPIDGVGDGDVVDPAPPAPGTPGTELVRPNKTALVKEWEDYAVALFEQSNGERGLSREDAEAASKADLIELFA